MTLQGLTQAMEIQTPVVYYYSYMLLKLEQGVLQLLIDLTALGERTCLLTFLNEVFPCGSGSSSASVERMQFQAETRQLLDIVAKSLYSDKEVSGTGAVCNLTPRL